MFHAFCVSCFTLGAAACVSCVSCFICQASGGVLCFSVSCFRADGPHRPSSQSRTGPQNFRACGAVGTWNLLPTHAGHSEPEPRNPVTPRSHPYERIIYCPWHVLPWRLADARSPACACQRAPRSFDLLEERERDGEGEGDELERSLKLKSRLQGLSIPASRYARKRCNARQDILRLRNEYVAYVAEQPSTSSAATAPEPQQPCGGDEADEEPYDPDDDEDDYEAKVAAPMTEEEREEAARAEAEHEYMYEQPFQDAFGGDTSGRDGGESPSDSVSDSDSELEIIEKLAKRCAPSDSPEYDDSDSSNGDD